MAKQKLPESEIRKILDKIPASELDYMEWRNVVFSAKSAGADMETVRAWSMQDDRYNQSNFNSTWNSTNEIGGVTVGTLIWEGQKRGYSLPAKFPERDRKDRSTDEDSRLDPWRMPPPPERTETDNGRTDGQCVRFLRSLFLPGDRVQVVTRTNEKGEPLPDGVSVPLAFLLSEQGQQWIKQNANPATGVWVKYNPLSDKPGENRKAFGDDDVTAFRYALIESDELPKSEQKKLIRQLRLPVAAVIDSGNKSIHAVVKVGAKDSEEYDERVSALYNTCKRFGLKPDPACKNPSRMCRLPGFQRTEGTQTLLYMSDGFEDFDSWRTWIDGQVDDMSVNLPDIVSFADVSGEKLPERKPVLIEDILRCGHIGLVTGPSKLGKTFLLMELAIAVATGSRWLGHGCKRGRVLYCDFELDNPSNANRFVDQIYALGADYEAVQRNLDILCLRGHLPSQEEFRRGIEVRTRGRDYSLIIIDPVYKLLQGDENAAHDVSQMFSYMQGIAVDTGAAVVLCHHHSKGGQAGKSSMDRGSGSGAFAREPDALIDLLELELTNTTRELYEFGETPVTAFQLEYALREFPPHAKEYGFFRYPVHIPDTMGLLKDARTAREALLKDAAKKNSKSKTDYKAVFDDVWDKLISYGRPTKEAFITGCRQLGISEDELNDDSLQRKMRNNGYNVGKGELKGYIIRKNLEKFEDERT